MVSCAGVATSWNLFCKCVQACRSPSAMLLLDPTTSLLSRCSQGVVEVELNEPSPSTVTSDGN